MSLEKFDFNGNDVRVIIDENGEPWWVATDVAKILEYRDSSNLVRRLDDDEKGTRSASTLGGEQDLTVINESGLYSSILGSKKPEAKAFKKWVTSEVLPAIRKTGSYGTVPRSFAEALELAAKQQRAIEDQEREIAALEPKAAELDRWTGSDSSVYVVEFAKTLGFTQPEMYEILRDNNVLFKQRQGDGQAFNVPKRGWEHCFEMVEEYLPAAKRYVKVPKVTPVGQIELRRFLEGRGISDPDFI